MSVNTEGSGFNVQAVENETGCEGSECLRIINKLKEFYEDTLRKIDEEIGSDGTEIKLKAMQSYISDLEEQNAMFLQTVVQLEQEAADRVTLLQEGLHRSSQAAVAYRTKLDDYDKDDFLEKLVLSAQNEELQHVQIEKLQNDVSNLLELIRRVREENSWDTTGLTFNEVTCEDIFGTEDIFSGHTVGSVRDSQLSAAFSISVETAHSTHENQGEGADNAYPNDEILRLHRDVERCTDGRERDVSKLAAKIAMLKFDIEQKDEQIQRCIRRIQAFRDMCNKCNEGSIEYQSQCGNAVNETPPDEFLRCSLEDFHKCFQRAIEEKEELIAKVKCLKTELKKIRAETEELSKSVNDMKQSNKDIRESLAAEVAEKHDEIIALRRMIQHLTETCREAEIMVRFKDDIIKQMRKDRKASEFKHVSRPECKSEGNNSQPDEQSLWNVSQHIDNDPNDNQQVQSAINKSDYWLEQVHTSPDEAEHSFPQKYDSTSKKSDVTDQLSVGEAHYKACQHNSPPASERQPSFDENDTSGHKIDTVHLENLAAEEKNNVDTAEHLKNLVLISDNTIKKQKENINGLQDTVKKYENDLNDLRIKAEQMELELNDSKLKYIQQITDQDAMINDLQKIVRSSQTEVEMLKEKCEKYERSAEAVQEERENLKTEMEKLQYNLMSREKVAANQEEIINILQDSVNIAQKEQQDLRQKLKDAETGKEKLLDTLQEERKKTENLQQALMITKRQLEDLQGNKYEVSVNSGMSWGWSHTSRNGHVNKRTVHDV